MKNIPHLLHDWILNYKTEGQLVLYSSWQATTFDFHFFRITSHLQVYLTH